MSDHTFRTEINPDKESSFDHEQFMVGGRASPKVKEYKKKATENMLIANKHREEGNPHLAEGWDILAEMYRETARIIQEREQRN